MNILRTNPHDTLSMWIAKSIIKMHKGMLSMTLSGGKGTTCVIALPGILSIDQFNTKILHDERKFVKPLRINSLRVYKAPNQDAKVLPECDPIAPLVESNGEQNKVTLHEHQVDTTPPVDNNNNSSSNNIMSEKFDITNIKYKILVVDDVLSNRKILARLMTGRGHTCDVAENGVECINKVKSKMELNDGKEYYDVILMDYEMPIMDGPTATNILKHELSYRVVVIGVTGNVLPADVAYFKSQGALEVLPKPVNISTLDSALLMAVQQGLL
jgi:CheY-like chemotaxis protein